LNTSRGAFYSCTGDLNLSGSSARRGDMFQARVDLKVKKNFRGHLRYERAIPGNYYRGREDGHYLRFEVICTLSCKILSSPKI
jgi:hypothetical protein